jgi:hypothetical protein
MLQPTYEINTRSIIFWWNFNAKAFSNSSQVEGVNVKDPFKIWTNIALFRAAYADLRRYLFSAYSFSS